MASGAGERFWSKVDTSGGPDACWPWTAYVARNGYGWFGIGTKTTTAHRVAYELCVGPLEPGMEVHHRCRTRACMNPAHLVPLTKADHAAIGPKTEQSHCIHGHAFDAANTYITPAGHRQCRACRAARERDRYQRRNKRQEEE